MSARTTSRETTGRAPEPRIGRHPLREPLRESHDASCARDPAELIARLTTSGTSASPASVVTVSVTTRLRPWHFRPSRTRFSVGRQVTGPSGPITSPKEGGAKPPCRPLGRQALRALTGAPVDPGSMVPDVAVSFHETRIGSQCRRAAAAARAHPSTCTYREWCPVSLESLAWPRPAGRTETLTRAITPTTDETKRRRPQ